MKKVNEMREKSFYERYLKRFLDIVLSLFAIIVLAPLLLVIAVFVRRKLGKPVLFTQERVGKDEKIFKIYKFRTMTDERDTDGNLLPDEVRLTSFGRLLRSTSIDELPELFNILKGEMSIIGPRPLPPCYLPYYTEQEQRRHSISPGLSGLAQINGRNNVSWDNKFAYDIEYLDKISFLQDLKIVLLTIKQVLIKDGIGQGEERPVNLYDIRKPRKAYLDTLDTNNTK